MTANAKVEQRHRQVAHLLKWDDEGIEATDVIAQSLANAEQRGREDEREAILRLERSHTTIWGWCAAIRARGQRKESE